MVDKEQYLGDKDINNKKDQDFSVQSGDEQKKTKENKQNKEKENQKDEKTKEPQSGSLKNEEKANDKKDLRSSGKNKENYNQLLEIVFSPKVTEENLQEVFEIGNKMFSKNKINEKQFDNLRFLLEKKLELGRVDKKIKEINKDYAKRFGGFMPSKEWQEDPGTPIPPGAEARFDMSPDGKKKPTVRWEDPYEGMASVEKEEIDELFKEKQKLEKELGIKRNLREGEKTEKDILVKDSKKAKEKKDIKIDKDSLLKKEGEQTSAKNESLNVEAIKDNRNKQLAEENGELGRVSKIVTEAIADGRDIPDELSKDNRKVIEKIVYETLLNLKGRSPEDIPSDLALKFEKERPSFNQENQENYIDWFRAKLYAINEEYINERSDTNFTLLWELRQALNDLWAKENDSSGEKNRVNGLRQKLTREFEAHMGLHNFIYLYRRVSGVGDIVAATALINMRGIEVLLEKKEIAEYLKIFAEKGKEIEKLGKEKFKLDWREGSADIKEMKRIETKEKEILKYLKDLQNGERDVGDGTREKVENPWAAIMAGGLFSALHGTARYKIVLNTGDFFFGRIYDIPTHAKRSWESLWGRNPFPGLYESLDLKLDNFWEKNIEPRNGELTINDLLNKKFDKDDGELTKEAVTGMDSDDIRKLILKPGQLVDELTDNKLKFMLEKFQHLKGAKRSDWYKNVLEQEILYYKDRNLSGIEWLPSWLRRSKSKKDHPSILPWTKETIKWKIIGFGRILTEEDKEYLLRKFVGNKFQRGSAEFTKTSAPVILNTIWGGIKGFFGPFFKYLFGDIK